MEIKNWKKDVIYLMMFGSIQFYVLMFISMLLYQGGTINNPNISGYSFFHNFLSDLGRYKAWSGKTNIISLVIFTISYSIFSISFLIYFIIMPYFFNEKKLEKYLSIIGSFSAIIAGISMTVVAFTPYDLYPVVHLNFVRIGYISIFLAMVIYFIPTFLNKEYPNKYAIIFLVYSLIMGSYMIVAHYFPDISKNELLMFQATFQKIALYGWTITSLIESYGSWKLVE